ncbi:uncharacterized protein LOC129611001 [Condylostylus longicornis]|uniref:uncharacterized protein LOC129611001 n=1 Tax=Condylostylus longicornis TaxID=2530218 RepID=UPI00244DF573|nr:uncharacterized protein LOC129611001 [Condylostylus longicornis]
MTKYFLICYLFIFTFNATWGQQYVTQTVYGFLDFTTTIGNTVMVFSPQSSAPETTPAPPSKPEKSVVIKTESSIPNQNHVPEIKPSKTITVVTQENKPKHVVSTVVQSFEVAPKKEPKPKISEKKKLSSKVEVVVVKETNKPVLPQTPKIEIHTQIESNVLIEADSSPAIAVANDLVEPEYDFLSREPSEFAEETYKVTNLKPSHRAKDSHDKKRQQSQSKDVIHPTGLVTKLGGTIVKDGATTVHETSVIGTYISGKYAQVLQSSSKVFKKPPPKLSTTPTLRILKTAAPAPPPPVKYRAEPAQQEHDDENVSSRTSQRRTSTSGNFKSRPRKPARDDHENVTTVNAGTVPPPSSKPGRNRHKSKHRRNKSTRTSHKSATIVAASAASVVPAENSYSRRAFKPRIQASAVEPSQQESTSLYKFKLNRSPGRWQYKTSPKPRVAIRKSNLDDPVENNGNTEVLSNDIPIGNANTRNDDTDLDSSGSINSGVLNDLDKNEKSDGKREKKLLIETLNVEISTPVNFKDTYYEIATIKTPFTFQVGTVKNTRYITVTSTMEKTLDPEPTATATLTEPLMENILTSSNRYLDQSLLESSIITLSPLHLSNDEETPALETTIETFSTTQEILRTQILPVVTNETRTSTVTLVQTYHITRLTTATKTLAPLEVYHKYKDFNGKLEEAGSEINLELDFGDDNDNDEDAGAVKRLPPELDIGMIGADFDLIDVRQGEQHERRSKPARQTHKNQNKDPIQNNLSPEQLQQLALLKLLNPAAQIPQVVTTSKPVLRLQTLYESHVIPIINGQSTAYSTISKAIGTVTKTELEYGTSTINPLPIPPVPLNPINPINPLFPQQQPQFHITSAPMVTQTVVTQTESKVLKLTFGAKTAYTTLFSTNVVPTVLTTFVTTTIPVQPTAAAFPGYFPAPFAPYPYVG